MNEVLIARHANEFYFGKKIFPLRKIIGGALAQQATPFRGPWNGLQSLLFLTT